MKMSPQFPEIKPVDSSLYEEAQKRLDALTKPKGSMGRLEEFSRRLYAVYGGAMPHTLKKAIVVFAGDHGVAKEGVSAYPQEVTRQMVLNFLGGGAGINVLGRHAGADVLVVDIGVNYDFGEQDGLISGKVVPGTRNILKGPAMTSDEALKCMDTGVAIARECALNGVSIIGTGEMGIGNTTPASAIASVFTGRPVREVTGRGTGITDDALLRKIKVIEEAIKLNRPNPDDPVGVLSKVGGAEIGGIAGLCLGAASEGIPIVIDGFISTAGALIACMIKPEVKDYMFSAHLSEEKGHRAMLERMGLKPIIDLGMRLGEGTGAALAMLIIEAAFKIYKEMATFEEAGVSEENKSEKDR